MPEKITSCPSVWHPANEKSWVGHNQLGEECGFESQRVCKQTQELGLCPVAQEFSNCDTWIQHQCLLETPHLLRQKLPSGYQQSVV
jgi:hypothetical protein